MAKSQDNSDDDTPYANPVELDKHASPSELKPGIPYKSTVNNTVDYGVFVSLRDSPTEISGLVHNSKLPPMTRPTDFSVGDVIIVEFDNRKPNGDISFKGLHAPDVAPEAPARSINGKGGNAPKNVSGRGTGASTLNEQLASIQSRLDAIETQPTGTLGLVQNPVRNAMETLAELNNDGYEMDSYDTSVQNGGDTVEITLVLSNDK